MRVSVIGGKEVSDEVYEKAEHIGELLSIRGYTIFCGGKMGIMEAVCKGAKDVDDGLTVGILPGEDLDEVNQYVDIPIVTGLGNARNFLVVLNGDIVLSIDGSYGTLSEIGHALDLGKPVVGLETYEFEEIRNVKNSREAIKKIEELT